VHSASERLPDAHLVWPRPMKPAMSPGRLRRTAHSLLGLALGVQAQVWVMAPESLVQQYSDSQGGIPGATSTFGAPFYGDRVLGQLSYGESKGNSWCTDEDYEVPGQPSLRGSNYKEVKLIHIVMVRRGGHCSITSKVRVAYQKGAHAVVVVDKEDSELTASDMKNVIVKDDGTGDEIHIPSILVSKEDGRRLINAVKLSEVIIELKWTIPTNHVVNAELWMSSASRESLAFLRDFSSKRRALNKVLAFQPHYSIFSLDSKDYDTIRNLCIDEDGRYCTEDPDGPGPITGRDVVKENMRQLCIHDLYKKDQLDSGAVKFAEQYWQYMERFIDRCPLDKFGQACSTKLMTEVGIDAGKVDDCVHTTGTRRLGEELRHRAWSPRALRINGWRFSGMMSADLVTRAICSGFIEQPFECQELLKPRDPFKAYEPPKGSQGVTFGTFITWIGVTVLLAVFLLLLYKRYLQKDMRATLREEVMLEVQSAMGQYSQMTGK